MINEVEDALNELAIAYQMLVNDIVAVVLDTLKVNPDSGALLFLQIFFSLLPLAVLQRKLPKKQFNKLIDILFILLSFVILNRLV